MEVVVYVKKVKFCVFVLRFYSPVNPIGSCQARSVYLTTQFYWAGLVLLSGYNQYCAHSFARNLQLPFLNQPRTHQYPDLLLSVSVNYHVAGAGDAYVTSESIFCKTPPILN